MRRSRWYRRAASSAPGDQQGLAQPLAVQAAHSTAAVRAAAQVDDDAQDFPRRHGDAPGGRAAPCVRSASATAPAAGVDGGDAGGNGEVLDAAGVGEALTVGVRADGSAVGRLDRRARLDHAGEFGDGVLGERVLVMERVLSLVAGGVRCRTAVGCADVPGLVRSDDGWRSGRRVRGWVDGCEGPSGRCVGLAAVRGQEVDGGEVVTGAICG